jgi:glycosyltransferase involved in cell wall biosynthesis
MPSGFLADYLETARRIAPGCLSAMALRSRSVAARELMAYAAAGTSATAADLLSAARDGATSGWRRRVDPEALADLARVVALQDVLPSDRVDAMAAYDAILEVFGRRRLPPRHQGFHAQLAACLGRRPRTRELLRTYGRVPAEIRTMLRVDLANPFVGSAGGAAHRWLAQFGALLPDARIRLADGAAPTGSQAGSPFDRLTTAGVPRVAHPERITVIVTSYRPGVGLITAVRSLLAQSWANLEVLIIDDASPPGHETMLDRCRAMDPRVRVVELPVNGGTYAARNTGLDLAAGEYVTFQDSDDWSHPRRLERQVEPLLADATVLATTSAGLRVTEDLLLTRLGRPRNRTLNPSSLMVRRDAAVARVGYFDTVRKAADSEYLERIRAALGDRAVAHLSDPYALIRLSAESLSRDEIREGWLHPSRAAYSSAYQAWHLRLATGEERLRPIGRPVRAPFAAPARLRGPTDRPAANRYDVAFLGDWRVLGETQRAMLDELLALTARGSRVGLIHVEGFRLASGRRLPLCRQAQELVNAGVVDQLLLPDEAEVGLLVVRDPTVLQFASRLPSRIRVGRAVIPTDRPPCGAGGAERWYVPAECAETVAALFSVEPLWCPVGRPVRNALAAELDPARISALDVPWLVDADRWGVDRRGFRSDRPVLGTHATDERSRFPGDRAALLSAYPVAPGIDVRFLGGGSVLRAVLGDDHQPPNWMLCRPAETTARSFVYQVDFLGHFPQPSVPAQPCRPVIEAMAAGCVVLLPHRFADAYGPAAVYCEPADVADVVTTYRSAAELFAEQSARGREYATRGYGADGYLRAVDALLEAGA